MPQSQKHGFIWENHIRNKIFNLDTVSNDTKTHDIPCLENKFNSTENISIKCSGSDIIYCGDIIRFFSYDFTKKNTIIVIYYKQNTEITKKILNIYEIDYNEELHNYLFGTLSLLELSEYDNFIKDIPPGKESRDQNKSIYLEKKGYLQHRHNMKIKIIPKVDSRTQRRVQCSFNITLIPEKFIMYKSSEELPNILRGGEIPLIIESSRRLRNKK